VFPGELSSKGSAYRVFLSPGWTYAGIVLGADTSPKAARALAQSLGSCVPEDFTLVRVATNRRLRLCRLPPKLHESPTTNVRWGSIRSGMGAPPSGQTPANNIFRKYVLMETYESMENDHAAQVQGLVPLGPFSQLSWQSRLCATPYSWRSCAFSAVFPTMAAQGLPSSASTASVMPLGPVPLAAPIPAPPVQ